MRIFLLSTALVLCFFICGTAQNTVGLISMNKEQTADGYNLFFPHNQADVFLINNCGELVNTWTDSADYRPGNMAYLTEEGNLLKCKRYFNATADSIWAGGGGQIVELLDWDNNLLWQFELKDEIDRLHHDVALLPDGNVLMIAWELKTEAEAIQAGRDPALLFQNKLWPDYILEYDPSQDAIVWEWHAWDHLIQDIDPTKDNFGVVAEHPELIDINWNTNDGFPDWMHSNSIDYNEELDQILLSVPHFDEIWIIDHSTTTEEAKGHTGGKSGKGGDLLFRWGNPVTYRADGPQQVFFAHDAQWVDDFVEEGNLYYGAISLFNNRVADDYSSVNILRPKIDPNTGAYAQTATTFAPSTFELNLLHPDTFPIFSSGLSGAQVLPNDNFLILSGRTGNVFEINAATNEVVWEYKIPLKGGSPVEQGTELALNNNITFRFTRYPTSYAAFQGKDLSPMNYLELTPNEDFCANVVSTNTRDIAFQGLTIFPNPATNFLTIDKGRLEITEWFIYDLLGRPIRSISLLESTTSIPVGDLSMGLYYLGTREVLARKFLIVE